MIKKRVYCDVCETELSGQYPGEDYTVVPVKEAIKRHHQQSEEVVKDYHLCSEEVEPTEIRSDRLFRAGDSVPMMLQVGMGYDYVARENFNSKFSSIALALEKAWSGE